MSGAIPDEFLDLVNGPRVAALTTVMPDGQPQTTVVWCDFDGAPYPQPDDKALWDVLPTELIAVMITAIQNEMQKLPNSMRPQRRR